MNGFWTTALVVATFFAVGVIVGIISVIAMAALRSDRDRKPPGPTPPTTLGSPPPAWSDPDEFV
jgi:hypothetical protein